MQSPRVPVLHSLLVRIQSGSINGEGLLEVKWVECALEGLPPSSYLRGFPLAASGEYFIPSDVLVASIDRRLTYLPTYLGRPQLSPSTDYPIASIFHTRPQLLDALKSGILLQGVQEGSSLYPSSSIPMRWFPLVAQGVDCSVPQDPSF